LHGRVLEVFLVEFLDLHNPKNKDWMIY
jgi:hypothetical protein